MRLPKEKRWATSRQISEQLSSSYNRVTMETLWKEVFRPDNGILLEIRIHGTNKADYRQLLTFLKSRYDLAYFEDNIEKALPNYATILKQHHLASVHITANVSNVKVNCFFFDEEEIVLDLLPDDVDAPEKAQGIFELMLSLSSILKKRVLLTAENGSATREWFERFAICTVDPSSNLVAYHPQA